MAEMISEKEAHWMHNMPTAFKVGSWDGPTNASGVPHGTGRAVADRGKLRLYETPKVYVGEMMDGVFHGQGTLTFNEPGGREYTGAFVLGRMCGHGTYTWGPLYKQGFVYVGAMHDDQMHGMGKMTFPSTDRPAVEGLFDCGKCTKADAHVIAGRTIIRRQKDAAKTTHVPRTNNLVRGGPPVQGQEGFTQRVADGTLTQQRVLVPQDMVGKIIGEHGIAVRTMQRRTCAHVEFRRNAHRARTSV